MTQPQQEYIITENQLEALAAGCQNDYGDWCRGVDEAFIETIRSRPARTPTSYVHVPNGKCPESIKICPEISCDKCRESALETCETCEWMIRADEREKYDAAIRNAFIERIEDTCETYPSDLGDMVLLSDIQSLRRTTTEAQK